MVIAHVERVRVLQRAVLGNFPRLQMLDRHLEVRSLGFENGPCDSRTRIAARTCSATSLIAATCESASDAST